MKRERQTLNEMRGIKDLVSPSPEGLPRLPPWTAPNGWDYWGRPWAYLHAPIGHVNVGVSSKLKPPSSRATVAVLVDCPHEPQFPPNMDVAQSASVVAGRVKNPPMPSVDTTPTDCPRGGYHDRASEGFPGRPVVTAKAAEAVCWSRPEPRTGTANPKLMQQVDTK